MKKLLLIFTLITANCFAQDTLSFKTNPEYLNAEYIMLMKTGLSVDTLDLNMYRYVVLYKHESSTFVFRADGKTTQQVTRWNVHSEVFENKGNLMNWLNNSYLKQTYSKENNFDSTAIKVYDIKKCKEVKLSFKIKEIIIPKRVEIQEERRTEKWFEILR